MNVKCQTCGNVYVTKMRDSSTWGCPTCPRVSTNGQTFTVDPYAVRTQFAPATRPATHKGDQK